MPRIIYIHVPKCGGSSFGKALRLRFLASQATIDLNQGDPSLQGEDRILSDYAARATQLRAHVAAGAHLITGHVQYDADLHAGDAHNYNFVTLLRDPVARFVSHYNYVQRAHPNPSRPDTLHAFLDTPDAARLASQYLFSFAGHSQDRVTDLDSCIARAIENLSRFDLVGDLGAASDFARRLRRITHTPILQWRLNAAPEPTEVPPELRARIEALCAPDIAIYDAVQTLRLAA